MGVDRGGGGEEGGGGYRGRLERGRGKSGSPAALWGGMEMGGKRRAGGTAWRPLRNE